MGRPLQWRGGAHDACGRPPVGGPGGDRRLGMVATAAVAVRDPARGGPFLPCPLHTVTGWWCPLCGATRGVHAMLHLDVAAALSACAADRRGAPAAAVGVGGVGLPAVGGPTIASPWRLPRWCGLAGLAALVAFGVARNLPWAPAAALAP